MKLAFYAALLAISLSLAPLKVLAATSSGPQSYMRLGVGVAGSAVRSGGEVKTFGFGYSDRLMDAKALSFLVYQYEAGAWIDTAGEGRKSSAYGSVEIGLRVNAGPFQVSSLHGPGIITTRDSYLGSVPQFFHDVCLGLQDDDTKAGIGLCYKHISNAGLLSKINKGRDFMTLKLSIPY